MLQEIKRLFSKDYQEDVKFLEFKSTMRQYVKLKSKGEGIDIKMERLRALGYISDCSIRVGEF